jgi:hypothetical protein
MWNIWKTGTMKAKVHSSNFLTNISPASGCIPSSHCIKWNPSPAQSCWESEFHCTYPANLWYTPPNQLSKSLRQNSQDIQLQQRQDKEYRPQSSILPNAKLKVMSIMMSVTLSCKPITLFRVLHNNTQVACSKDFAQWEHRQAWIMSWRNFDKRR